jgi:hypothetical protein
VGRRVDCGGLAPVPSIYTNGQRSCETRARSTTRWGQHQNERLTPRAGRPEAVRRRCSRPPQHREGPCLQEEPPSNEKLDLSAQKVSLRLTLGDGLMVTASRSKGPIAEAVHIISNPGLSPGGHPFTST